jgi:hypothetical protein
LENNVRLQQTRAMWGLPLTVRVSSNTQILTTYLSGNVNVQLWALYARILYTQQADMVQI